MAVCSLETLAFEERKNSQVSTGRGGGEGEGGQTTAAGAPQAGGRAEHP
jgi:hypothetical protein